MKDRTKNQRMSRAENVTLWVLQILTAAAFIVAGFGALSGQPMIVATFDKIGIGQWFRYVAGGIEVASAIMLLIPRLTPVGAALLVCTMGGAVLSHLFLIGGSPVAALVMLCLAAIILWGRFGTLKALLSKLPAPAASAPKLRDCDKFFTRSVTFSIEETYSDQRERARACSSSTHETFRGFQKRQQSAP